MIGYSSRSFGAFGVFGFLILAAHAALAGTIFVSKAGSNANDGLSWATAKQTVQAGLQAAVAGDRVWVAAGRYVERITLKAGVGLYGGLAGNEDAATFDLAARNFIANVTVLDGNELGSVVTSPGSATETCRLDGFTVTGGKANHGAGVNISGSSPTIVNNRIVGNLSTSEGGGIRLNGSTRALIANNVICGNSAALFGGGVATAGLPTTGTLPRLINNTIIGNQAQMGSVSFWGGNLRMVNNVIAYNRTGLQRFNGGGSITHIRNNCFYGNVGDPPGMSVVGVNGNFSADPRIADTRYGRAHLQPDSPCIDAGSTADAGELLDFEGQTRIQGAAVDIGADESNGASWLPGPNVVVRVSLAGNDLNDGLSWQAPKRTVQAAIDAASAVGGDVWIQTGAYTERVALRATVHVFGSFAGSETATDQRDFQLNTSTLDGQRLGSVIRVNAGFHVSALDGLSIRGGRAPNGGGLYAKRASPLVANCTFTNNEATDAGGAIYVSEGFPEIVNTLLSGNTAVNGGGGFACDESDPTIEDCEFVQNSAPTGGAAKLRSAATIVRTSIHANTATAGSGGGISCAIGQSFVRDCLIYGNSATGNGGGILIESGSITVTGNEIFANLAQSGAGIQVSGSINALIDGNVVARNSAAASGGGIATSVSSGGSANIKNNLIVQNSAGVSGGGVATSQSLLAANTIVANRAPQGGAISGTSTTGVESSLVAFNSSGFFTTSSSGAQPYFVANCVFGNADYDFSGIPNPTGTSSNISLDPQFRVAPSPGLDGIWATDDDDLGDLRLTIASPCIDGGNPQVLPPPGTEFDPAGQDRVVDGDGDGQRRIDIGAYEYIPTIAGDFDGDCSIGLTDLATLLIHFGTPDGSRYEDGDFDRDGDVDLVDLANVLAGFGSACD